MADLLSLVGRTPLVELKACSPKPGVRLFAKLEGQNPTGSIKDRIVAFMLQRALADGRLKPGQELVEATTGNTGISLAMAGGRLGHPVRAVVPESVFPDLVQALKAYGAEVEWVPPNLGIKSAIDVAKDIVRRDDAFLLDQFASANNPLTHYETTGVEILEQCPDVDMLVAGIGTGGTIMGIGRRLREHNPATQLIAAEPHTGNHLQGLRSMDDGYVPPILDVASLDAKILVTAASAFRAARELLAREGILAGLSSGAVLHAALRWAQRIDRGTMVLIFADSGWKYLGSPAFKLDEPLPEDEDSLDDILWW
ncbi:MAG: PLP-dependent cysteine synthase family protein [Dehalococcoidia bacterium]